MDDPYTALLLSEPIRLITSLILASEFLCMNARVRLLQKITLRLVKCITNLQRPEVYKKT